MVEPESVNKLKAIKNKIKNACVEAGRGEHELSLIAVSKTYPAENIEPLLETGHRSFGENRVQEAQKKWPELKNKYPDTELHLIGPLQTNKTKDALRLFNVIHTLDRPKLADVIALEIKTINIKPKILVQVNIGNEPQKAGVKMEDLGKFLDYCHEKKLNISGLMCIPPVEENPQPYFKKLAEFARGHQLRELSMGMSGDYETAIQEGATYVRVGSAIFGERQ